MVTTTSCDVCGEFHEIEDVTLKYYLCPKCEKEQEGLCIMCGIQLKDGEEQFQCCKVCE